MKKDHFILSHKWTNHPTNRDWKVIYYRPEAKGYTAQIPSCGLFSKEEADRHSESCHGDCEGRPAKPIINKEIMKLEEDLKKLKEMLEEIEKDD